MQLKRTYRLMLLVLCLLLICSFLGSCRAEFRFSREPETIVEISLLVLDKAKKQLDMEECIVLTSIRQEQHKDFIADLCNVSCYYYRNDPQGYPAGQVVRITYADGCFDLLDSGAACGYTKEGTEIPGRLARECVYFDTEEFDALCTRYFGSLYDPMYGISTGAD